MIDKQYMEDAPHGSASLKDQKRRESPAGFHFYWSYWDNPGKFYLKYCLGLRPRFTPPPLLFGGCFHEGMHTLWSTGDVGEAIKTFEYEMGIRSFEYEDQEKAAEDLKRGRILLDAYAFTYEDHDPEVYRYVEGETLYELWLGPEDSPFLFTIRPDLLVQDKRNKEYIVFDHKTSGWSAGGTIDSEKKKEQLTSYIWGYHKARPELNVAHALIDVLFMRGASGTPKMLRSEPIRFHERRLQKFELSLYGTILEVSQKVKGLSVYPAPMLFPNSGSYFTDAYDDIINLDLKPGDVPHGFVRDEWHDLTTIFEPIYDIEYFFPYKEN